MEVGAYGPPSYPTTACWLLLIGQLIGSPAFSAALSRSNPVKPLSDSLR